MPETRIPQGGTHFFFANDDAPYVLRPLNGFLCDHRQCAGFVVRTPQRFYGIDARYVAKSTAPMRFDEHGKTKRFHGAFPIEWKSKVVQGFGGNARNVRLRWQNDGFGNANAQTCGEGCAKEFVVGDAPKRIGHHAGAFEDGEFENGLITRDFVRDAIDDHVVRRRFIDGGDVDLGVTGHDTGISAGDFGDQSIGKGTFSAHEEPNTKDQEAFLQRIGAGVTTDHLI